MKTDRQQAVRRATLSVGAWLHMLLFWSFVAVPLAWGVSSTLKKAAALFS